MGDCHVSEPFTTPYGYSHSSYKKKVTTSHYSLGRQADNMMIEAIVQSCMVRVAVTIGAYGYGLYESVSCHCKLQMLSYLLKFLAGLLYM